jgi:lactoylglutathione lyase
MSTESDVAERSERRIPETLRLRGIAPSLTVSDLDASLTWYRDVVGFTVGELWEDEGKVLGAELVAGSARLMIGQDDWAKGRDRKKGEGFRLYLTTSQDVDEIATAIQSRGGTLETEPEDMPWGARAFSVVDPDGFNITISSQP